MFVLFRLCQDRLAGVMPDLSAFRLTPLGMEVRAALGPAETAGMAEAPAHV